MSGIRSSAKGILEAYANDLRSRKPHRNVLRQRKESALRRYGDQLRVALVGMFIRSAVQQFAVGNRRMARYFYDGAFEFGSRNLVRGTLLKVCLAAAQRSYQAGDHQCVWRLLAAVHSYAPDCMTYGEVNELFARYGVPLHGLEPLADEESARWLRTAGFTLATASTAD